MKKSVFLLVILLSGCARYGFYEVDPDHYHSTTAPLQLPSSVSMDRDYAQYPMPAPVAAQGTVSDIPPDLGVMPQHGNTSEDD